MLCSKGNDPRGSYINQARSKDVIFGRARGRWGVDG